MKTDININILDILNKGIAEAIEAAVSKRMDEARADFNTRLEVIELHYEAEQASYNASLKELREEYQNLIAELDAWKERMSDYQQTLFDEPDNDDAEANEIVRNVAADFLIKYYGRDNGACLVGKSTESVVKKFYWWCNANRITLPDGKGQKRVVTNTAKKLFDLKLAYHHKIYVSKDEVVVDAD